MILLLIIVAFVALTIAFPAPEFKHTDDSEGMGDEMMGGGL